MIFKKILKFDLRNYQFHEHFGSTTDFASMAESHFSDNVPFLIEPAGAEYCTELSAIKMAKSQTGNDYDLDSAWANTPHNDQGATPQASLGSVVKNGLKNIATGNWDKLWVDYYQTNKSPNLDAFDSVRSAMFITKSGMTVASNFYQNWLTALINSIINSATNIISEHDWYVRDWKVVNGDTVFEVDFHLGYPDYMTRDEFNTEVGKLGCGAYVAYQQASAKEIEKWYVQLLIDFMSLCGNYFANQILALKNLLVQLNS